MNSHTDKKLAARVATPPSTLWLPKESACPTILEFLCQRFDKIPRSTWEQRLSEGKVSIVDGETLQLDSPYIGDRRLQYFRELEHEPEVPFYETVLFEDANILVVDKPHFLTIHPVGQYIEQTLVHRLRKKFQNDEIAPAHRLDRLTAGLVLFTKNKAARSAYQKLFLHHDIQKTYHAIGTQPSNNQREWKVKNELVAGEPWFLMRVGEGLPNSESHIRIIAQQNELCKFELKPISGKKHQLRVHMCAIGSAILHDPLYPIFTGKGNDDYSKPLQLLAHQLEFIDPLSQDQQRFTSELKLLF